MIEDISSSRDENRLLAFSIKRPVLTMLILFFLACVFKFLDSFLFRLDELIGEAILTKALGFALVVAYVWACRRSLRDIGFHSRHIRASLAFALIGFGLIYVFAFGAQLIALRLNGEEAGLVLAAVDPKTGLSGGLLFGVWLLATNLVNSAMEEGLFRGTMIRHFLLRFSGWGAILLQACLFALWHLSWPLRHLLDGQATLGEAAFEAFTLLLATFISGIVYGYLYFKTDNLWGPFLGHTMNNGIFNVLFIKTSLGMQSGLEFMLFQVVFLLGYIILIPVIAFSTKRMATPVVEPWGTFRMDDAPSNEVMPL